VRGYLSTHVRRYKHITPFRWFYTPNSCYFSWFYSSLITGCITRFKCLVLIIHL
jgi:hypothetical protein